MSVNPESPDENDPVVDALLSEYLGGARPRALDSDTLHGIIANSTFLDEQEVRRLELACEKAQNERVGSSKPVQVYSTIARSTVPTSRSMTSRLAMGSLATVAACLLILIASQLKLNKENSTGNGLASNDASKDAVTDHRQQKVENQSSRVTEVVTDSSDTHPLQDGSDLPKELPFTKDSDNGTDVVKTVVESKVPREVTDRGQVSATINSQFAQLWGRLKLEPSLSTEFEPWARRTALALTGEPVAPEMLAVLTQGASDAERRKQFLNQVMNSDAFVKLWTRKILTNYFDLSDNTSDNVSRAAAELVAKSVREDKPLVELWKPLLESKGSGSIWLASHIGQDAKKMASSLYSMGAGNQVSCLQCHQADEVRTQRVVESNATEPYWHLAALLNKVQIAGDAAVQWKMDRDLYYEIDAGQIRFAIAGFANFGENSQMRAVTSETEASEAMNSWSRWLADSQASHEKYVDVIWSGLLQNALGSSVVEKPEFSELAELRAYLAKASKNSQHSLRSLIAAIVLSDVFSTPTTNVTESWYLAASESNIEQLRQQLRAFAQFSPPSEPMVTDSHQLIGWLSHLSKPTASVLGQPKQLDLDKANPPKLSPTDNELSVSQQVWLIRSKHHSAGTNEWINRLANSKMNWEMVTDHIYLAELGRQAKSAEQQAAKNMLDVSGNRTNAIGRILASLASE